MRAPGQIVAIVIAALLSTLSTGGCGGVAGPSQNRIEEFPGVIEPFGSSTHDFSVSKTGEYEIRFSALDPSANVLVEVALAQHVGGACQQLLNVGFGGLNTIALIGAIVSGRYCVIVFDEGIIPQRVSYTVRVSHP